MKATSRHPGGRHGVGRALSLVWVLLALAGQASALTPDDRARHVSGMVRAVGAVSATQAALVNGRAPDKPEVLAQHWDAGLQDGANRFPIPARVTPWVSGAGASRQAEFVFRDGDGYSLLVFAGPQGGSAFSLLWRPDRVVAQVDPGDFPATAPTDLGSVPELPLRARVLDFPELPTATAFAPDGAGYAVGGYGGSIAFYDVASGMLVRRWQAHAARGGEVTTLQYSPDGRTLLSASCDGTLCTWDTDTGIARTTLHLPGAKAIVCDAQYDAAGTLLAVAAVGSEQGSGLFEVESGRQVARVGNHCFDVAWGADGLVAFATVRRSPNTITLYDAVQQREVTSLALPPNVYTECVRFSPDGQTLAAATSSGHLLVWDVSTGARLFALRLDARPLNAFCYSPDGRHLLVNRMGGQELLALDAFSGRTICRITAPRICCALGYRPDGLVLGAGDTVLTANGLGLQDAVNGMRLLSLPAEVAALIPRVE